MRGVPTRDASRSLWYFRNALVQKAFRRERHEAFWKIQEIFAQFKELSYLCNQIMNQNYNRCKSYE